MGQCLCFSPYRIGDDIGSAFAMGLVGGSIFHSFTGYKNAAKGQKLVLKFVYCYYSPLGVHDERSKNEEYPDRSPICSMGRNVQYNRLLLSGYSKEGVSI